MSVPKRKGGGLSNDPAPRYVDCFEVALTILRESADRWALGAPESPPTAEILEKLLEPFRREKFLKQPW